jgi:hypothetical protein
MRIAAEIVVGYVVSKMPYRKDLDSCTDICYNANHLEQHSADSFAASWNNAAVVKVPGAPL